MSKLIMEPALIAWLQAEIAKPEVAETNENFVSAASCLLDAAKSDKCYDSFDVSDVSAYIWSRYPMQEESAIQAEAGGAEFLAVRETWDRFEEAFDTMQDDEDEDEDDSDDEPEPEGGPDPDLLRDQRNDDKLTGDATPAFDSLASDGDE